MRIRSMTGFGKAEARLSQGNYHVFIRGVNSKSLEVLFHNFPEEFVELEENVRVLIEDKVKRGRIDVFFKTDEKFTKHKQEYEQMYRKIRRLEKELKLPPEPLKIADIIAIAGQAQVFKKEVDDRPNKKAQTLFLRACAQALAHFLDFKVQQGISIAHILRKLTASLDARLNKIITVQRTLTQAPGPAASANVEEELALIKFYIEKLDRLIFSQEMLKKGKFLDFLSQEILRELNTLLAKLKDKNLCLFAIQMKVDLESIREQVQNIE